MEFPSNHIRIEAASRQHSSDGVVVLQLADGGWAIYGQMEPGVPAMRTYAPPGGLEPAIAAFVADRRVQRVAFNRARPSDPPKAPHAGKPAGKTLTLKDLGDLGL